MPKSIPISVRLSDDDVAFLAEYEAQGARTPSEKLRDILREARARQEGGQDATACEELLRQMARPSERRIRQLQRETGQRSDLVIKLYERLPEMMAELVAAAPEAGGGEAELKRFEAALAAELFALIEEVFDLGLTSQSRTYEPRLMEGRLEPVLEIARLLERKRQETAGE
ncbi:hypothetical protein [Labrenzia sp. PHM005]|uniref:hypothetical protein n=1 Tax=Labrenzia sp. PHM005 TaxID=2590016 RepID=UPI00114014B3|nr:hypothetical protein [Labrenzia sp. PHM005]QDG78441.1 hypothetical protein FJ695_22685 [Labrenzia sp. PHM005]